MVAELKIVGMSCEHCAGRVEKALKAVPGVDGADVVLEPGSATVSGKSFRVDDLLEAVDRVGFSATAE
jgi:copper chaperone CopZ